MDWETGETGRGGYPHSMTSPWVLKGCREMAEPGAQQFSLDIPMADFFQVFAQMSHLSEGSSHPGSRLPISLLRIIFF